MGTSSSRHICRTALGTFTFVVGLLCLVGSVVFGCIQTVRVSVPREQSGAEVANVTSAGAACGLAIAGGLCFIATAIAEVNAVRQTNEKE